MFAHRTAAAVRIGIRNCLIDNRKDIDPIVNDPAAAIEAYLTYTIVLLFRRRLR